MTRAFVCGLLLSWPGWVAAQEGSQAPDDAVVGTAEPARAPGAEVVFEGSEQTEPYSVHRIAMGLALVSHAVPMLELGIGGRYGPAGRFGWEVRALIGSWVPEPASRLAYGLRGRVLAYGSSPEEGGWWWGHAGGLVIATQGGGGALVGLLAGLGIDVLRGAGWLIAFDVSVGLRINGGGAGRPEDERAATSRSLVGCGLGFAASL